MQQREQRPQLPASCVPKRKLGHAAAEWHITEVHASQHCNMITQAHARTQLHKKCLSHELHLLAYAVLLLQLVPCVGLFSFLSQDPV